VSVMEASFCQRMYRMSECRKNECEVSDPKCTKKLDEEMELLVEFQTIREPAIVYKETAKLGHLSPVPPCGHCHQRFETASRRIAASKQRFPMFSTECIVHGFSLPGCQTRRGIFCYAC
jgi:hypothetical protein